MTLDGAQKIACPACMIQHWVGIVFIPGATLEQTLKLVQDYDRHAEIYAPDVMRAKILFHSGDDFRIFMRFHRTKIVTVVLDTEHSVHYQHIDATHAVSRAVSTRVQEVENAGASSEYDLAEGKDNGYLWRINNYWRFLERDGGTYVQCESVSLSRDIPTGPGVADRAVRGKRSAGIVAVHAGSYTQGRCSCAEIYPRPLELVSDDAPLSCSRYARHERMPP